jgi:hypothetical protein
MISGTTFRRQIGEVQNKMEAHDQSWSFLPVIVGAAAAMYFFVTPGLNAEEGSVATRSTRPGATNQTTPTRHDAFR